MNFSKFSSLYATSVPFECKISAIFHSVQVTIVKGTHHLGASCPRVGWGAYHPHSVDDTGSVVHDPPLGLPGLATDHREAGGVTGHQGTRTVCGEIFLGEMVLV